MATEFTDQQQEVIDHRGGNLLVSAAAGSGKTTVLVERIVQMLLNREHPVSIDEMLVVTFTNAAAASMKQKIEERLKKELARMEEESASESAKEYVAMQIRMVPLSSIMTNHSFSLQLVKDYVTRIEGLDPGMRTAEETESQLLMSEAIRDVMEESYSKALTGRSVESEDFMAFVEHFKDGTRTDALESLILRVYRFMISAPDPDLWLKKAIDELDPDYEGEGNLIQIGALKPEDEKRKKDIKEHLLPAMRGLQQILLRFDKKFHQAKLEKNLIDFNDFEHFALQILSDPSVCEAVSSKYQYIFIDEYQDCNLLQETIIDKIARKNENGQNINVFMVGDVKQCIYQFRMAEPSLFQEKYRTYGHVEGTELKLLNTNFRSDTAVINGINAVFSSLMREEAGGIEYGPGESLYPPQGRKEEENDQRAVRLVVQEIKGAEAQRKAEAVYVADEIKKLLDSGQYEPSDIVILGRARTNFDNCREELENRGILVSAARKKSFYEALEIKTVVDLLKTLDNPHQDIPLVGVMLSPIGKFNENDLGRIRMADHDGDFFDALLSYQDRGAEGETLTKVREFLDMISRFRSLSQRKSVHDLLWTIYLETGYYLFASGMPEGENRKMNLDLLLEKSVEFEKGIFSGLYQFLRYVEQSEETEDKTEEANRGTEGGRAIRMMTIHGSKGLEFKVVFLVGLGNLFNLRDASGPLILHKKYGIAAEMIDPKRNIVFEPVKKDFLKEKIREESLAEEIRLLYVAMTRAEKKLYLVGGRDAQKEGKTEAKTENGRLKTEYILKARNALQWVEPIIKENKPDSIAYEVRIPDVEEKESVSVTRESLRQDGEQQKRLQAKVEALSEEQLTDIKNKLLWSYPEQWRTRVPQVLSVSSVKHARMEEVAAAMMEDGKVTEEQKAYFIPADDEQPTRGAMRGTAYHEVMSAAPLESLADPSQTEQAIRDLVLRHLLTQEEADSIDRRWIEKFAKSDLYRRLTAIQKTHPEKIHKEQSFVLNLKLSELKEMSPQFDYGGTGEERIILQGIIDLWFEEDGKIVLADYKTDGVLDESRIAGYGVQLAIYQRALEESFGVRVAEKMLYDVRRGREIHC